MINIVITFVYDIYSYVLNNPLRFTDPSGYMYDPAEHEPTGPLLIKGYAPRYPKSWLGRSGDPFAGMGFDYGNLASAYGLSMNYRPNEAGYGFDHYFTYMEGTDGRAAWVKNTSMYTFNPSNYEYVDISWDDKFMYITTVGKSDPVSNKEKWFNSDYGIMVEYDKATNLYYRPYSSVVVDPTDLLYEAKALASIHAADVMATADLFIIGLLARIANNTSLGADVISNTLQSTKVGSNIAYQLSYSKLFTQGSKLLKPLGYVGIGLSIPYDFYLSYSGQQSWTTFGLNSTVSISAVIIGGWYGLGLVGFYSLGQYGYKVTMEGLDQGVIKPNPDLTRNLIPGLAPTPVIY